MTIIALGLAVVAVQIFEYLAGAYGAKRYGSSRWGIYGAVIGGMVGAVLFNIPGLMIGIFARGAVPGLLFAGKGMRQSLEIGWGGVLGFLGVR
ncbi:MAG: DUF456 domain-containing protein [Candidatus Moranbacteria bacterium]|nr:DUF456 domain-containing protein [Candidatus Moranbacteria bacterium]